MFSISSAIFLTLIECAQMPHSWCLITDNRNLFTATGCQASRLKPWNRGEHTFPKLPRRAGSSSSHWGQQAGWAAAPRPGRSQEENGPGQLCVCGMSQACDQVSSVSFSLLDSLGVQLGISKFRNNMCCYIGVLCSLRFLEYELFQLCVSEGWWLLFELFESLFELTLLSYLNHFYVTRKHQTA